MTVLGKKFPAFQLPDQNEKVWKNADLAGKWAVIFLYPRAMTPGCTTESCDFRDNENRIKKLGAQVFGLSADKPGTQKKFEEKESLNFPLLADLEHELIEKLGSWIEKSMYGKKYMGIDRSTFIVDPSGKIAAEWRNVKVPGHVAEVVEKLKELAASS